MSAGHDQTPGYRATIASFDWTMALDDLGWSGRDTVDIAT